MNIIKFDVLCLSLSFFDCAGSLLLLRLFLVAMTSASVVVHVLLIIVASCVVEHRLL